MGERTAATGKRATRCRKREDKEAKRQAGTGGERQKSKGGKR